MTEHDGTTVLLAGASGDTGRRVLYLLAQSELTVRAITSSPETVSRLEAAGADEVFVCDLLDQRDAERTVEGVDVVLTTVGSTPKEVLLADELVDGPGNIHLAESAAAAGVETIVMQSALEVDNDRAGPLARLFGMTLGPVLEAKTEAERTIRKSGLRYTILRVGVLTTTAATNDVQIARAGSGLWGAVSRADVARVMTAAPFTSAAADRTLEVVRNPLLRERSEHIDWQYP